METAMLEKPSAAKSGITEREERSAKLGRLEDGGLNPYPHHYERTHAIARLAACYGAMETGAEAAVDVSVCGRLGQIRRHGGLIFGDLCDESGKIQIAVSRRHNHGVFALFADLDRGDHVGVKSRRIFRTKTRELTIGADDVTVLSKCLSPLPDKHHGLQDMEQIRGRRYLHLLVDAKARARFRQRSRVLSNLRRLLEMRGFVEVQTPILQPVYGGAEARPFVTHHNALDRDLYLRISPELYLKRLIVGGFERVFEIGSNFRNEGIDATHNPEFTMMELYWAYADYNDIMALTEEIVSYLADKVLDSPYVCSRLTAAAHEIDLTPPWRRLTMFDAIAKYTAEDVGEIRSVEEAREVARRLDLEVAEGMTPEEVIVEIFEERVQPQLIQPTFITDYFAELCPLTKRHRENSRLAERFELFIDGLEFANAYTELTDPREQARQFALQADKREGGDQEAHPPDHDFVQALEYGMPPTGGLGIGIDRLVMLLLGASNIRDVILFPLSRK